MGLKEGVGRIEEDHLSALVSSRIMWRGMQAPHYGEEIPCVNLAKDS